MVSAGKHSVLSESTMGAVNRGALVVSLVVSAYLMAVGVASGRAGWLSWLSLLPLFYAMRTCAPAPAFLCGMLWGGCLWAFSIAAGDLACLTTTRSFVVSTGVAAVYAGAGAWLTRWMGFSPFVLGCAWAGVELAFAQLGLRDGLLGGAAGDGGVVSWVGHAFGYVLVAFLAAVVNAWLVHLLAGVRLTLVRCGDRDARADRREHLPPWDFLCTPRFATKSCQPRAPPLSGSA